MKSFTEMLTEVQRATSKQALDILQEFHEQAQEEYEKFLASEAELERKIRELTEQQRINAVGLLRAKNVMEEARTAVLNGLSERYNMRLTRKAPDQSSTDGDS